MTPEKQQQLETLLLELHGTVSSKYGVLYIHQTKREAHYHLCDGAKDITATSLGKLLELNKQHNPEEARKAKIAKLQAELDELTKDAA